MALAATKSKAPSNVGWGAGTAAWDRWLHVVSEQHLRDMLSSLYVNDGVILALILSCNCPVLRKTNRVATADRDCTRGEML